MRQPKPILRVTCSYEADSAISILVGDEKVVFAVSGASITLNGEAAASAVAVLAMKIDASIVLDRPVSTKYLHGLHHIGAIFHQWFGFSPVSVASESSTLLTIEKTSGTRVGSFFSGGADSLYTLLMHLDEITDLILVIGMDIPMADTKQAEVTEHAARMVAEQFGKNLVVIRTNLRASIERASIDWGTQAHGSVMASVGHLLSSEFCKIYIASSHTYQGLFPWGSHPVLDHHWGSERLAFVHDGCDATRVQKIKRISENATALSALRVCWMSSGGVYNCGVCSKCVRTMISLIAVGALTRATSFPSTLAPKTVASLKLHKANDMLFAIENIAALEASGVAPDIAAALKSALNRSRLRAGITALIALFPKLEKRLKALHALTKPPLRPPEEVGAAFDVVPSRHL